MLLFGYAIRKPNKLFSFFLSFQNEINEVPFFFFFLPYELALKIFQYLGKAELGKCAQVSSAGSLLPTSNEHVCSSSSKAL